MLGLLALSLGAVVAGCGSEEQEPADGDVYVEVQGEGTFYFEAVVSEVGEACEGLRETHGDEAAERCLADAIVVHSRGVGDDSEIAISVGLCRGLSEESSVDLGDAESSCVPSSVFVTIGRRVLTASSGTIDVALGAEADVLVDAMVDDATDPDDFPIQVQAHLILER
jgi:hypothetical protein